MARRIERLTHRLSATHGTLRSLSPLATLDRGYAIVARRSDGKILTDSADATAGTPVVLRLARGTLAATVEKSDPPEEQ
jgi:exodeoxyribonuclease VII large subunit